jgi:hypothetical protein
MNNMENMIVKLLISLITERQVLKRKIIGDKSF